MENLKEPVNILGLMGNFMMGNGKMGCGKEKECGRVRKAMNTLGSGSWAKQMDMEFING